MRLTLEEIISFLLDTPMFEHLDPSELAQIVSIMQIVQMREGHAVFREGEPGDAWYVVSEGEVRVEKDGETVARFGPRSCFGEMAILDGGPRSASVLIDEDTRVFKFPRKEFLALLKANNLAAYKLVHQMALALVRRQRATTQQLVKILADGDVDPLRPLVGVATSAE